MKYVHGQPFTEYLVESPDNPQNPELPEKYDQTAKAIKLLLSIEVSNMITPGPVGGGTVEHLLCKNTIASTEYTSVMQL